MFDNPEKEGQFNTLQPHEARLVAIDDAIRNLEKNASVVAFNQQRQRAAEQVAIPVSPLVPTAERGVYTVPDISSEPSVDSARQGVDAAFEGPEEGYYAQAAA